MKLLNKMKKSFKKIYFEQGFKLLGIIFLIYSMELYRQLKPSFILLVIFAFIFYVIFPSEKIVDMMLKRSKK